MIVAIDPSYTRAGVATYSNDSKSLTKIPGNKKSGNFSFYSITSETCKSSFAHLSHRVDGICEKLDKFLQDTLIESQDSVDTTFEYFVVEYAVQDDSWGAGLYMLDYGIVRTLKKYGVPIYLVGPNVCNSFLGKRSVAKSELVEMCKSKILWKGPRINHDEATAAVLHLAVVKKLEFRLATPKVYMLDCNQEVKEL